MLIVDMPMPTNCCDCALDCPIKGELVRCGERNHWIRNEDYSYVGRCELWNVYFENDFYCADGERKDGAV